MPGLDAVLDGGLVRATLTLVAGSLGTGKTTLLLGFVLAGIALGEPALYLGFRETPAQLARKARVFGDGSALARALAPGGGLELLYLPPVELDPDIVADQLLTAIDRTGARRLVVDSIAELERALARGGDPGRVEEYLAALAVVLRRRGVTSLLIRETPLALAQTLDIAVDPLGMVADNILLLQQIVTNGRLRRFFSAMKTRFAPHDEAMYELVIGPPDGIRLAPVKEWIGQEGPQPAKDVP
jgi:circadian clock protein KaiC